MPISATGLPNDPNAQEYYIEVLKVSLGLRQIKELGSIAFQQWDEPLDADLWRAFAETERTAVPVEIERPKRVFDFEEEHGSEHGNHKSSRRVSKPLLVTAITLAAIILYPCIHPRTTCEPAAVLADSLDAKWSESTYANGEILYVNKRPIRLQKGYARITFDYGAEIIVEGPSEFELKAADSVMLHSGRLFAHVPPGAGGFTVTTSCSSIIDLGTEFAVSVDSKGDVDLHTLRGMVSLIPGMKGQTARSQILTQGLARRINTAGEVVEIPLQRDRFARLISSASKLIWRGQEEISLVDILAGGNGFGSGDYGQIVDVTTGGRTDKVTYRVRSSKGFVEVKHNPFVDGVFVPDGNDDGVLQVSSKDHRYMDCPDTEGVYWTEVLLNHAAGNTDDGKRITISLDGKTYDRIENPSLFMHANVGVTFDLDKIRTAMPDLNITRFTALCGVADSAKFDERADPVADFIVLLDGEEIYRRNKVSVDGGAESIDVKIGDGDRFLSLMVTDGGNGHQYDWGLFARPFLHIERVNGR